MAEVTNPDTGITVNTDGDAAGGAAEETGEDTEGQGAGSGDGDGDAAKNTDDAPEGGKDGGKPAEGAEEDTEAEDKSDEDKSDDEENSGAPEKYEPFTMPEGVEYDEESAAAFGEIAREFDLNQEKAQKLVDAHIAEVQKLGEKLVADQKDQWDKMKADWADECRKSTELQNEEGKIDESLSIAKAAVEELGGEKLKEALDLTGAGDHPAVVKAFYTLGKYISDDGEFSFGNSQADTRSRAEKMFPSMKPKK